MVVGIVLVVLVGIEQVLNVVDGGGSGNLVAYDEQVLTVRGVCLVDEGKALRAQVAGSSELISGEVAVVDIGDEGSGGGVGDVVDENAANALGANEGISTLPNGADGQGLWFWALVIRAIVELCLFVIGVVVEDTRLVELSGDLFELGAGIEDNVAL